MFLALAVNNPCSGVLMMGLLNSFTGFIVLMIDTSCCFHYIITLLILNLIITLYKSKYQFKIPVFKTWWVCLRINIACTCVLFYVMVLLISGSLDFHHSIPTISARNVLLMWDFKIVFFSVLCHSQQKFVVETMGLDERAANKSLEGKHIHLSYHWQVR